jgi:hypothetical protein
MKKTILLFIACNIGCTLIAQNIEDDAIKIKKNEISTNIFDLVVAGSLNVTYERFLTNNISWSGSATFFDTYGYYDASYLESTSGFSLRGSANFYISKRRKFEGLYFYPLIKFRSGKITSDYDVFVYDDQGNFVNTNSRSYYIDGFSAGVGLGNKWVIQNKYTVTIFGEIARNLGGNLDRENAVLSNVEPRFGINFGYRF